MIRAYPDRASLLSNQRAVATWFAHTLQPAPGRAIAAAPQFTVRQMQPHRPTCILASGDQPPVAAARADFRRTHLSMFHDRDPSALGADPEPALAVLEEIDYLAAVQPWSVVLVKDFEVNSVETHQAVE